MKKIKVGLCGLGKINLILKELILSQPKFELVGILSQKKQESCYKKWEEFPIIPEIIIDFSHHDNLYPLLKYALAHNIKLLICTTGFQPKHLSKIRSYAKKIPILLSYNTSLGIQSLKFILENFGQFFYNYGDIEIIEKHHNLKKDAPSGTAITLYESLQKKIKTKLNPMTNYTSGTIRKKQDIGLHSIRAGSIFGEHEIIVALENEIISIKHTALNRKVFASGALAAAQFLLKIKNPIKLYEMQDVFNTNFC